MSEGGVSGVVLPLMVDREAYGDGVAEVPFDRPYDMDEHTDEAAGEFE